MTTKYRKGFLERDVEDLKALVKLYESKVKAAGPENDGPHRVKLQAAKEQLDRRKRDLKAAND